MKIRVVRREQDQERGAVMVLTALIMSVLAIFAGGTMAAVTLYGANQEGRRAADLDALAAAANLPTANLSVCNTAICNPVQVPTGNNFCPPPEQGINNHVCTDLGTVDLNQALPLPNTNWSLGSCGIAGEQFSGTARSPINHVFTSGSGYSCTRTPMFSQPWMQMIADCIQNLSNCTGVQNSLNSILPSPAGTALGTAIQSALTAADATEKLVSATMMSTLSTLNSNGVFCLAFGGNGCLQPLINALGGSQLKLDLANLSPALLTPQVKVTVQQQVSVPGAALVGWGNSTITNTATARRAFKNAVLLPAIGPKRADGTYIINPNQTLGVAKDLTMTALGLADQTVSPLVQNALTPIVCSSNPTPCQIPSLLGDQLSDLNDLFNPPGGQPPPDGNAILLDAVQNARPVLVATLGQVTKPTDVINGSIWNALAPLLGLGVGNLLVAPALDFVPMTLQNGGAVGYVATPVRTVQLAGQTTGIYRARLID
jgi:hypothetical protein